jgi:putative transposase
LAVVIDLFSRKIIGWGMSDRLKETLMIDALKMALFRRKISADLLLHSNSGSQYASDNFQQLLCENSIKCSMSRKSNC